MDYLKNYRFWKTDSFFDESTRNELSSLNEETDQKEIEDRFYQDLEFGTAGLRGIMGAGTNRMNKYIVAKVTSGLGKYLLEEFGANACANRGVVISYDTRNNSYEFAKTSANILSGMGIKVYLYSAGRPIPVLSFSIREKHAVSGIMVTASHNPKEYNGYKVYDELGCQLGVEGAKRVYDYIKRIDDYKTISLNGNESFIEMIDLTDEFVNTILKQSKFNDTGAKGNLNIVYTPLHGTGLVPVLKALERDGFSNVKVVGEQEKPDGNFSTVVSPNPEDRRALELGIKLAESHGSDIVLGTDPDCDRVGAAVKINDGYALLTGNQVGALLVDFIIKNTDLSTIKKPAVITTIVTSSLGLEIARKHNIATFLTLTGFKFIGEKIAQFEEAKRNNDKTRDFDYLFGYEESYGYLAGTYARDKDAVVSVMLISEMAAAYKAQGKTLVDRLNEIYAEYGYHLETQDSFTLKGKDGLEKIASMMSELRNGKSPFENTLNVIDYNVPVKAEEGFGYLPTSNVLKYVLSDGSWVAVRPSGTEPKIKIYYALKSSDKASAEKGLEVIRNTIKAKLGL